MEDYISNSKIEIVKQFISAYNSLNVEKMLEFLHPEIIFKNISNGKVSVETHGISEFQEIANQSLAIFKERKQKIVSYSEVEDKVKLIISFHAILAIDLPNGLKIGDSIDLKGESEYLFKDNLLLSIIDDS